MGGAGFGSTSGFGPKAAITGGSILLSLGLAGCAAASQPAAKGGHQNLAAASASRPSTTASSSLTTYFYNKARDGVGPLSPSLRHLQSAWSNGNIDGAVYAEPLVYDGEVLVATEDDDLYALSDATGAIRWHVNVGTPAQSSSVQAAPGLGGCGDIYPLGITGTPAIDTANGVLYLAAEVQKAGTSSWEGVRHEMVAISLAHHKILWREGIDPPGAGNGNNGTYIIAAEQERSAVTLANGRAYVPFGGLDGDCSAYHGFVVSRPITGKGALTRYQTQSSREDAIWATSGAAVDAVGDLYVATGNGASVSSGDPFDYGDSVVKLSPGLKTLGYFAPSSWLALSAGDLDLGSDGPTLLPNGLLFQSGKAGLANSGGGQVSWGYLLRTKALGGIGGSAYRGVVCPNAGYVFGANSSATVKVGGVDHTLVFVPCPSGTVALEVNTGPKASFHRLWEASSGSPNGPPIVAGGLVWALSTGNDGGGDPSDVLYGMNPATGRVLVTEQVGNVENFATPAAAAGLMVVASADGVQAYRPST